MVETKICKGCGEAKPLLDFYANKTCKDGYSGKCKKCILAYHKEYQKTHSEEIKEKNREYQKKNRDKLSQKRKEYYQNNRADLLAKAAKYRQTHRDELKKYFKDRYEKNRRKILDSREEYNREHRDERVKYLRAYYRDNKKRLLEYSNAKKRERLKTDPVFKIKRQLRLLTWRAFNKNGEVSLARAKEFLGCSPEFFTEYLKRTWSVKYHTEWNGQPYNIDHIIPLLEAHTIDEVKKLGHYTNVRLLTPEDNMAKGLKERERKKEVKKY